MKQPDIVIYMSDQHGANFVQWEDMPVDTSNLAAMKENGITFEEAYTSCPLCVPARMSMMSSLLPSKTGVFDNNYTLSNTTPCFTHALVEAGYETVLIGRMHFIGIDQRHGFTKRLAPDITPVSWDKPFKSLRKERGKTVRAFSAEGATKLVGAGQAMTTEYDQMVMKQTLDYLSQDHDKPQFILVGAFGPHCPYITNEELYKKYLSRVQEPNFFDMATIPDFIKNNVILNKRIKNDEVNLDIAKGCLAAYLGQIEVMDSQIGELKKAFEEYTKKKDSKGIFGYISDHGDALGERRMYGKQTFFDKSVRVPMLFEGIDIPKGKVVKEPVSLMDVGPTICALAGTSFEIGDGISLVPYIEGKDNPQPERIVISQLIDQTADGPCASVMLRYMQYKYIYYHRIEKKLLFNLEQDPNEERNLTQELKDVVRWFDEKISESIDCNKMEQTFINHKRNAEWFKLYEKATYSDDSERWKENSEASKGYLTLEVVDTIELS